MTSETQPEDQQSAAEVVDEAEDPEGARAGRPRAQDVPENPEEAVPFLMSALSEAQEQANAHLDDYQRALAELDNVRKRTARERIELVAHASEHVVNQLLPTLDAFDAALSHVPQSESEEKMLEGFRRTHTQLLDTLHVEGLEIIPAHGEAFDPAVHEAISAPPAPGGDLVVTQEARRGYTLRGKVIRASLVIVDHEPSVSAPAARSEREDST